MNDKYRWNFRLDKMRAVLRAPEDEDEFDRVLMEDFGFRRLSEAEAAQLSKEEIERLEDAYDVARAREILKAVREGRTEFVSGQELEEELDRICGREPSRGGS